MFQQKKFAVCLDYNIMTFKKSGAHTRDKVHTHQTRPHPPLPQDNSNVKCCDNSKEPSRKKAGNKLQPGTSNYKQLDSADMEFKQDTPDVASHGEMSREEKFYFSIVCNIICLLYLFYLCYNTDWDMKLVFTMVGIFILATFMVVMLQVFFG